MTVAKATAEPSQLPSVSLACHFLRSPGAFRSGSKSLALQYVGAGRPAAVQKHDARTCNTFCRLLYLRCASLVFVVSLFIVERWQNPTSGLVVVFNLEDRHRKESCAASKFVWQFLHTVNECYERRKKADVYAELSGNWLDAI